VVGVLAAHPDSRARASSCASSGRSHPHHRGQARPRHRLDPGRREQAVTVAERDELRRPLPDVLAWAQAGVRWWPSSTRQNRALYERFGTVRSSLLSLVARDGKLDLYDGVLRARDADGALIFDGVAARTTTRTSARTCGRGAT
jgi:NAD-reducing hydrogenase large subunit